MGQSSFGVAMTYAEVIALAVRDAARSAACSPSAASMNGWQSLMMRFICDERDYSGLCRCIGLKISYERIVVACCLLLGKGMSRAEIIRHLDTEYYSECEPDKARSRYRSILRGTSGCYKTDQAYLGEFMLLLEASEAAKLYVAEYNASSLKSGE